MKQFNFIPAYQFDELFNDKPLIIFYGSSTGYYQLNDTKYIISEGCHIATKTGKKYTLNPNFDMINPVRKSIKNL